MKEQVTLGALCAASFLIPVVLGTLRIRSYVAVALVMGGVALLSYSRWEKEIMEQSPYLSSFQELNLTRGFNSNELRAAKKQYFKLYHPDMVKDEKQKQERMENFKKMEDFMSVVSNVHKREMLDRLNTVIHPRFEADE
jgi:hypothetical protein